jgi:spore coat protein U-like protein
MQKHHKALAAILAACTCGYSAAAGSQDLTITATVQAVCSFTAATSSIAFNIDPSAAGPQTGFTNIAYQCTKNAAAPTIGVGGTSTGTLTTGRLLTGPASATMAYTLTVGAHSPATPQGFSGSSTVPITASVTQAAYQDMAAGAYSETVTLVISP